MSGIISLIIELSLTIYTLYDELFVPSFSRNLIAMLVVHRFITIQHLPARNRIISHHLFHFYLTLFTYAHYLYFLPYLSFPVLHVFRNIRLNHLWLQVLICPSFTLHCSLPQSERTLDQIPWQIHLLKQYRLVANT